MHNKSRTVLKGKTNCTNEILFLMGNNKVPGMKGNGPDKNGLQDTDNYRAWGFSCYETHYNLFR